jgi:hypothetical protein
MFLTSHQFFFILVSNGSVPFLSSCNLLDLSSCRIMIDKKSFLLHIQVSLKGRSKRVQHHNPLDYLECLDLHLKKLVLINYQGIKRDVEFANFFLMNAKVLEMVELRTQRPSCDSKYLTKQHTKLQLKNRASKDTQVLFMCISLRYSNDLIDIRHMHDMSIVDPFDLLLCSCRCIQSL